MDRADTVLPADDEDGHCIFPRHFILNHRYQVRTLIGRDTFALVWLADDLVLRRRVAIKVIKGSDAKMFELEYMRNRYLSERGPSKIVALYESILHFDHPCLVFELAAQNVLTFLNDLDSTCVCLPIRILKKITRDTLEGLAFMHANGVIHTDLKPENIMATRPLFPFGPWPGDPEASVFRCVEDDPGSLDFKLGDHGNSCHVAGPMSNFIQTPQYRSPEVLLGIAYDASADIWSVACMAFELTTRHYLFDPTADQSASEMSDHTVVCDARHLMMIERVCGRIPRDWARTGLHYDALFRNGELIVGAPEQAVDLFDLLRGHDVPAQEAADLVQFLEAMLAVVPGERLTAEEMLRSPWLLAG
jgi:serine/threonine protein kinase